jgi:chorismate mutase/prephenate dehydratase
LTGFEHFDDVFDAVLNQKIEMGVVPCENTIAGKVSEVSERLAKDEFTIIDRIRIKINQMLVAPAGTELSSIRKIYSHHKALEQCKNFLETLPDCQILPYSTTSAAAAAVAALNDKCSAAIASETAAKLNRLVVIKDNIQDKENNYTEFVLFKAKCKITTE